MRFWLSLQVFGVPTSQFEFHSAVVYECPVNPVAEGFKGSDAEHSWLLLPQVLIGSPPERVLSKYTTRDWKGQTVEIEGGKKKNVLILTTKSQISEKFEHLDFKKINRSKSKLLLMRITIWKSRKMLHLHIPTENHRHMTKQMQTMLPESVKVPTSPGNLEGGSCTVPTGLLPLGRLSAGRQNNWHVYPHNRYHSSGSENNTSILSFNTQLQGNYNTPMSLSALPVYQQD